MKTAKKIILTIIILIYCGFWAYGIIFVNYFVQDEIIWTIDAMYHRAHPFLSYAENWDIYIPEDARLEFRYSNVVWLDGEHYSIAKFDSRPDEFLQTFSNDMSEKHWDRFQFAMDCLVKSGIDETKVEYPNENSLFFVKEDDEDTLFLIYNQNTNKLYILISYT